MRDKVPYHNDYIGDLIVIILTIIFTIVFPNVFRKANGTNGGGDPANENPSGRRR